MVEKRTMLYVYYDMKTVQDISSDRYYYITMDTTIHMAHLSPCKEKKNKNYFDLAIELRGSGLY